MTQSLIIPTTLEFQKLAAETTLPDEPNAWSDEALQELYKQIPYLADFDLNVVMETVDGERGYGLGHVEVSNKSEAPMGSPPEQLQAAGIRKSRIPIIIRDNKLMPFDVIITDDARALPLTESRLRQAMFRPQNFDVTSKTPGDQSMIGQLYPPYRQNYGFGGGGVAVSAGMGGKTASKHASVLAAVLPTANASDLHDFKEHLLDQATKIAYLQNSATFDSIEAIGAAEPVSFEKRASEVLQVQPSVVQVVKLAEGYAVKTAHHRMWEPRTEVMNRGQVVQRFGTKTALAADLNGAATVASGQGVSEDEGYATQAAGPISAPGMYQVQTVDGDMLTGVAVPNLLDIDGTALPIALFTDGQHAAVQADLSGIPSGDFQLPGTLPAEQATGHGVFINVEGGPPCATLPLTLGASLQGPGTDEMPRFQAETFDGRSVQVSVQPYAMKVLNTDGVMLIPQGWVWLPLDNAEEVTLAETPGEVGKVASLRRKIAQVEVLAGGADCFALRGLPVEKLASDERQFLTQDEALFVLVGLGAEPAYAQRKLAQAYGAPSKTASVRVGHALQLASEMRGESYTRAEEYLSQVPSFRHRMWKEAASIPDPTAVDAVLSLGFINPENLATYIGYLPTLDEAQRRLCEILIAARLGMRELSEGAIERAIRALEDVIEGLKCIAFQS